MGTAGGAGVPRPGSQAARGWHRPCCPRGCRDALCAACPRGRWGQRRLRPRGAGELGPQGKGCRGGEGQHSSFLRRSQGGGGAPRPHSGRVCNMCVFPFPGRMFIFYGNKTSTQFLNFTPTLICSDGLQADILGSVSPTPETGSHLGFRGGFEEGVFFFLNQIRGCSS